MTSEPPETVVALPVAYKDPKQQPGLVPVDASKCTHLRSTYEVDVRGGKCRCKSCGAEVSAMFVLEQCMNTESIWHRHHAVYNDEMRRLRERSATKCQHCGKMTRISGR